jgi:hypothetical protein
MKTPDQLVAEIEARVTPTIGHTFVIRDGEHFETYEGRISAVDFHNLLGLYRSAAAASKLSAFVAKLADAVDNIRIHNNSRLTEDDKWGGKYSAPTHWYVVDESQADWDCGYPGDMISDHATLAEARIGHALALIEAAGKP